MKTKLNLDSFLREGLSRFEYHDASGTHVVTRTIREQGGRWYVTEVYPFKEFKSVYELRSDGLYIAEQLTHEIVDAAGNRLDPFTLDIPAQPVLGEPLSCHTPTKDGVLLDMTLTVTAGTWRDLPCIKVNCQVNMEEMQIETEQWWCEGFGLVKQLFGRPSAATMELIES